MQAFRRTMPDLFCCFGTQSHDESLRSSSLHRIQANKDSPISMSVPGASVPHALDSPDALQKIFASNTSTRGYHAVQAASPTRLNAHGSLDLSFRFGSESSPKKAPGRMEQLTHHVKQRLSESRLSRGGEQADNESVAVPVQISSLEQVSAVDANQHLLGESQKSLGLIDLLASRAPSDGGYDSDAKSMQTSTILSATRPFQPGPRNVRKPLPPFSKSHIDEQLARIEQAPSTIKPPIARYRSNSSTSLETPRKVSFWEALQSSIDQAPGDTLRRLSNGIAENAITVPTTPELRALRMPSTGSLVVEPRFALPEPLQATSSGAYPSHDKDRQAEEVLKTLTDLVQHITTAKQGGLASLSTNSSITNLDPALIKFLDNFATLEQIALEHTNEAAEEYSPPVTAIKNGSKEPLSNVSASEPAIPCEPRPVAIVEPQEISPKSADSESLHLFNMRISQKLASASHIPALSSANASNNTSTKSLAEISPSPSPKHGRVLSRGRAPTFITIEHTRRPSDPDTKRIFESAKLSNYYLNRHRNISQGSTACQDRPLKGKPQTVIDDSSSYYGSVADGADEKEISLSVLRKPSLKNPNSFAVGGRSASGPVPSTRGMANIESGVSRELGARLGSSSFQKAQRPDKELEFPQVVVKNQVAAPSKQSKFIKVDTTPTPISRKLRSSTEANEQMDKIDLETNENQYCGLRDSTSTQAVEDRRNENFSDIDFATTSFAMAAKVNSSRTEDGWLSQGRRTGWGFDFANKSPAKYTDDTDGRIHGNGNHSLHLGGSLEASAIWHKAFKRLGEPQDLGRLLATPQFDREGRRKLSIRSISDQGQPSRSRSHSPAAHRRSRSVDLEHRESFGEEAAHRSRRKSVPLLSQLILRPTQKETQTLPKRERLKKKSLVDIGRRVITSGAFAETGRALGLKDPLGIWGRFANHTRAQRNGPAGFNDDVIVRDFNQENGRWSHNTSEDSEPNSSPDPRPRTYRNLLGFTQRRSMTNMPIATSSAERIKQRRKAFRGRFKKLYRTKSSEIHAYAIAQGHRSSVSTGQTAEYPELECLPGEGSFERSPSADAIGQRAHGTSDLDLGLGASLDTISEITSRRSRSMHSHTIPWSKKDAEEWSKLYKDCVGSLSALRSDDGINRNVDNTAAAGSRRVFSLTSALSDSTVDFEATLKKDAEDAKENLVRQLQSSSENEKVLRMPGSFV